MKNEVIDDLIPVWNQIIFSALLKNLGPVSDLHNNRGPGYHPHLGSWNAYSRGLEYLGRCKHNVKLLLEISGDRTTHKDYRYVVVTLAH